MKNTITTLLLLALISSCKTMKTDSVTASAKDGNSSQTMQINNPVIKGKYTGDPAALVYKDKVYLYAGHDEAPNDFNFYKMNEWLVYSSSDMVNWQEHPVPLKVTDFAWAKSDAWAAQVIERNGKFYFKDALGKALITNDMTTKTNISWDDIDPTVMIDDDGQAYLFWGNTVCHYAKLKANMVELDGPIQTISLPNFTEAPWIHKKKDWYYLSYAYQFPEKIAYAMSKSINGPWEYKGILNEIAGNSNTNHQSIIEFKGKDYFIYHNGATQPNGGSFRRSVCIDRLYYNEDGTLKRVIMTTEGIQK